MKNRLILLLAIAFALMAAFGTLKYLEDLKETYKKSGNYTQVAVAATHIPAKTPINEKMLKFLEVPADYILPGSIIDPKDALGKLARSDIFPGEQILQSKLINKNDPAGGLSAKISPGQRAVTIAVDQVSALSGLVTPGDKVDVAVTLAGNGGALTTTVLYNIPVLAINKNTSPTNTNDKSNPATATLMVTPTQAQELILATETGAVRLLLRAPDDDRAAGIPPTQKDDLLH
jgi:pilus assembly protein CpaB